MTLRTNYNKICFYCGLAFKSNRNTAKYCSSQHGSLYRQHGENRALWREHNVILENNDNIILENNQKAFVNNAQAMVDEATRHQVQKLLLEKKQQNAALQKAYNDYVNPEDDFWSISIKASVLNTKYAYTGLFPSQRKEIIVQGDFLLSLSSGDLFKIKPLALCGSEEFKLIKWTWTQPE